MLWRLAFLAWARASLAVITGVVFVGTAVVVVVAVGWLVRIGGDVGTIESALPQRSWSVIGPDWMSLLLLVLSLMMFSGSTIAMIRP